VLFLGRVQETVVSRCCF